MKFAMTSLASRSPSYSNTHRTFSPRPRTSIFASRDIDGAIVPALAKVFIDPPPTAPFSLQRSIPFHAEGADGSEEKKEVICEPPSECFSPAKTMKRSMSSEKEAVIGCGQELTTGMHRGETLRHIYNRIFRNT